VLDRIEPTVERLVAHVEEHSDFRQPVPHEAEPASGRGAEGTKK
jgi:hypothetical protein